MIERQGLLTRIRNWYKGFYVEPDHSGSYWMLEPRVCSCGHYLFLHDGDGCPGPSREQWLQWGRLSWTLRCRCRVRKIVFEVEDSDHD